MSFPPATEMFQFAGFASRAYGFSAGYPLRGGLPHSDIPGSPIARISPGLFAACHVLHRLSVPRHPPDALPSRLSATPNGKNHSGETAGFAEATGEALASPKAPAQSRFRQPPCRRRGIPLSSAEPAKPRRLKTLSGSPTHRPRGPCGGWIPPRSHNLLIHICPSTTAPGGHHSLPEAISFFMPRIGSGDAPAGPLGVAAQRLSAGSQPALRPGFRRNLRFHLSPRRKLRFHRWWR